MAETSHLKKSIKELTHKVEKTRADVRGIKAVMRRIMTFLGLRRDATPTPSPEPARETTTGRTRTTTIPEDERSVAPTKAEGRAFRREMRKHGIDEESSFRGSGPGESADTPPEDVRAVR